MDDAIAPLRQVAQQFEFAVREAHRLIAARGSLRPEVDQQSSDGHALDRGMRAAKHCPNARKQLVEIDRFGDVVVGAELQPGDSIRLLPARRQNNDRDFPPSPEPRAQVHAIDVGERQVEQHEVRFEPANAGQRRVAGADRLHLVALERQVVPDDRPENRVILDDQNPSCHAVFHFNGGRHNLSHLAPPTSHIDKDPAFRHLFSEEMP